MGYSQESKAYRLYDPEAKKIVVSRDVVFWEQPHTVEEEVCPSTLSSAVKVTHLVPASKPELQNEEEYFEEKTPPRPQHALAPQGKPLPKWARQLFDEKDPVPDLVESSANGLRRSKRMMLTCMFVSRMASMW